MIEKRKVCIPLNKLKVEFNKETQSDENSLKKYTSLFDLEPDVNNLVFLKIPEYKDKYLNKYKYTLSYKDAKNLECFNEADEKALINNINKQLDDLSFEGVKIQEIKILSKAKLIDFFLYLLLLKPYQYNFDEIMKKINSLRLGIDLIFKAPIYLGNDELKYYFYYEIFIEFFLSTEEKEIKSKINKIIYKSPGLDYFPTVDNNSAEYSEVDLSDFFERKQKLIEFIGNDKKNIIDIKEDIQYEKTKENIIELDENLEIQKDDNSNDKKDNKKSSNKKITEKNIIQDKKYRLFINKLDYFKIFRKTIFNIFFDSKNDEEILEKLKYLYFYILLTIKSTNLRNQKFIDSFHMKNDKFDREKMEIHKEQIQSLFGGDYDKVLIGNIAQPLIFFDNIGNPFIDNYLCFPFPGSMHKSFIEYNEDIYKEFHEFLKYIYKSKLLQDIYYLCPGFKDFEYPFKNDDILNEMFENTYYIPCESENLYSYTQENLVSIFIPVNLENEIIIIFQFI